MRHHFVVSNYINLLNTLLLTENRVHHKDNDKYKLNISS